VATTIYLGAALHSSDMCEPERPELSLAEVVALVSEDKPVPGIKEVPDVQLGMQNSSPATQTVRRKPWERDNDQSV